MKSLYDSLAEPEAVSTQSAPNLLTEVLSSQQTVSTLEAKIMQLQAENARLQRLVSTQSAQEPNKIGSNQQTSQQKGGRAYASQVSPERRREIARMGAEAKKKKHQKIPIGFVPAEHHPDSYFPNE